LGSPLDRHVALVGFMGAGKSTVGAEVAERLGRRLVDLDRELETQAAVSIPEFFATRGEAEFRILEQKLTGDALDRGEPAVLALGGGAILSEQTRRKLRERAVTVLLEVTVEEAWQRSRDSGRPLAASEEQLRALFAQRRPLYEQAADVTAGDADDVVLAAAGVHAGPGLLERLGELVPGRGRVALVSDAQVAGIYGADVQLALGARLASTHTLPPGEEAKTITACDRLWEELTLERGDALAALGGGCTTDPAGFVAATYLRGLDWVAVPTTLVGQVDAAIGGKTAVNLAKGKNLVGAFHWPVSTVIDPVVLVTLPEAERLEGMSEVVKTGLLAGEPFWELPEPELVRRCAIFKTEVCLRDPRERSERAVLNLGHTFAHALEAAASYREVSHGAAVALGLRAALGLSIRHLDLDREVLDAVEVKLRPQPVRVDAERAWAALTRDKKVEGGLPKLVLLEEPGKPVRGVALPEHEVRAALESLIAK
jgi:shikimate kinase / 3-dehydroquinate synthase